jgi:ComF family protein
MGAPFPLNLLYPAVCPVCVLREPQTDRPLCRLCNRTLEFVPGPACERCGGVLDTEHAECAECRDNPRRWQHAASAFVFCGLARHCVHRFKYHGDTTLAPFLAASAWQAWQRNNADVHLDCIAPVPLHWFRRFARGYNQAELICRELHQLNGIPTEPLLKRHRWTSPQANLSRSKRQKNLRNAFIIRPGQEAKDKHVLLVDDVMTTGATLHACTKQLLKAGVATVHVLTVARR